MTELGKADTGRGQPDVCLVLMPYAPLERPSLALGLLKSCLSRGGIRAEVVYANLAFTRRIGFHTYRFVETALSEYQAAEWTFSSAAFPDFETDPADYFQFMFDGGEHMEPLLTAKDAVFLWNRVRELARPFIEQTARDIVSKKPRIVGCSSSIYQNVATLAVLKRIRELDSGIVTLMGGANCEGKMGVGLIREFPWVDFVVSGEADEIFDGLCRLLIAKGRDASSTELPPGVIGQVHLRDPQGTYRLTTNPPRCIAMDLDALPIPDFDDYFSSLEQAGFADNVRPGLVMETSRGCWWGQRRPCSFCGLNGMGRVYRRKSPGRIIDEFTTLSQRYGLSDFLQVDTIVDMSYIHQVLPVLSKTDRRYAVMIETKANLKKDDLRLMRDAGARWIQPGIESLHDSVLNLMGKGTSLLQNVQTLKHARELGIRLSWNMLSGFPGEKDEWFLEMSALLPCLMHLQPPNYMTRIRYDRFSAYHRDPSRYGLSLAPLRPYLWIYPFASPRLDSLVYFFERRNPYMDFNRKRQFGPGHEALYAQIVEWIRLFCCRDQPRLEALFEDGHAVITDTRPCAVQTSRRLDGLPCRILQACDSAVSMKDLRQMLDGEWDSDAIHKAIETLREEKLVLEHKGALLGLPVIGRTPVLLRLEELPGGFARLPDYKRLRQSILGRRILGLHDSAFAQLFTGQHTPGSR